KDKLKITFAPLGRNQRVKTALASRPQAGKKLYQNLAIPSWMRESLVVVSVAFMNKESSKNELLENDCPIELPILLLSPFENWVLNAEQANINVDVKQLAAFINSYLTLHKTC
uniref:tRNA lysidine(34) synthetase TilS C-terminal domain-containing protein n=1 Tax=uncultured Psychrobacter sp. TaxID=259303 RepID=UPI0026097C5D